MWSTIFKAGLALLALTVLRLYTILPTHNRPYKPKTKRRPDESCTLAVFLGSGGHTSEALAMLSGIDFQRYRPRKYFISEGDALSVRKVRDLEQSKRSVTNTSPVQTYDIITVPRARRVHQSLLTTPFTALVSLSSCIYYMTVYPLIGSLSGNASFIEVLILNGPGTCLMLCIAAYVNKFLGLPSPEIIYIESFARVKDLSLSGKLIQPLVDRFVVQWPELQQSHPRAECHGVLV